MLLSLPLEPGSEHSLVVEVDSGEVPGELVLASSNSGEVAAKAKESLEDALASLKPALRKVTGLVAELSPERAEVEFGLKVGGETGLIVAKGTAEVNFKVTMTWEKRQGDGE